jgi:hypothetical protein
MLGLARLKRRKQDSPRADDTRAPAPPPSQRTALT